MPSLPTHPFMRAFAALMVDGHFDEHFELRTGAAARGGMRSVGRQSQCAAGTGWQLHGVWYTGEFGCDSGAGKLFGWLHYFSISYMPTSIEFRRSSHHRALQNDAKAAMRSRNQFSNVCAHHRNSHWSASLFPHLPVSSSIALAT